MQFVIFLIMAALPLGVYAGMKAREPFLIRGAVAEIAGKCNAKLASLARETDIAVAEAAREARAAADAIERTPEEAIALQALCDRSASCRSKSKKGN